MKQQHRVCLICCFRNCVMLHTGKWVNKRESEFGWRERIPKQREMMIMIGLFFLFSVNQSRRKNSKKRWIWTNAGPKSRAKWLELKFSKKFFVILHSKIEFEKWEKIAGKFRRKNFFSSNKKVYRDFSFSKKSHVHPWCECWFWIFTQQKYFPDKNYFLFLRMIGEVFSFCFLSVFQWKQKNFSIEKFEFEKGDWFYFLANFVHSIQFNSINRFIVPGMLLAMRFFVVVVFYVEI